MEKKETRGRKPLEHKSHTCYVCVPYEVDLALKKFCENKNTNISQTILEAIKYYLDF